MGLSTCLAADPWPALYEACSWRLWPLISEEYIFSQIISGLPSFHTHIWWSSLVLSPAGGPIQHLFPRGALATPTLAWKIPWVEEPGRLQSMGSQRVGHDWVTSLSLFTFHFHALEKAMATHSSVLAWRIPGLGEPDGLLSMGSHRVRHDWGDLAAVAAAAAGFQDLGVLGRERGNE